MSFKQLGAFGLAAGIAMTLGSSAWAATTSVSINFSTPLNTLPSASVQLPEPNFARTVVAGDSFLDTYFFSLTETSDVFGGVSSPLAFFKGLTVKGVAFDSITLAAVGGATSASSSALPSFTFEGLTAGNYQLTIAGHAIGSQGGSYIGELAATPAVPEPGTIALTLSGLALVGAIARRKKA
ncbi:FxDxF family PEP-CTERM protein [Aquabacterium sp.]|uniref:FxDxF family PEP-CTERM protein n=1 Tax=Aquabacterium sp. TaxID=1872578 RepID=UPI002487C69C|nr:FxDxF family PEP-CTERM protein [Aquabacterium sp.]MDI1349250.1 FxDxF family PEP-CTERM protein [Aquabacterium sp.]